MSKALIEKPEGGKPVRKKKVRPLRYDVTTSDGVQNISANWDAIPKDNLLDVIRSTVGSDSTDFLATILNQVVGASFAMDHKDDKVISRHAGSLTAAMFGIKPQDELEGMLVAQMVAVHNQAMEFMQLTVSNKLKPDDAPLPPVSRKSSC